MIDTMSVELRIRNNNVECDYGMIEHGSPRPEHGQIGHLMLATHDYVAQLAQDGPSPDPYGAGALHSVTTDGERIFAHINYHGQHWTWELLDAHWEDGQGPPILVGKWPD